MFAHATARGMRDDKKDAYTACLHAKNVRWHLGDIALKQGAIGKFQNPRCFCGISCLPTSYEATKNVWMTSVIFETWLRKWDAKLSRRQRKIVLFIDNCTAHPHIQDLGLIFLPPKTMSEIQPSDKGIIKTCKTYYRKSMVRRLIDHGNTMADFKITLLDPLQMIK